jgi:CBS-domain-containing membrane protein
VPVLNAEGVMVGNISAEHIFFIATVRNKMYFLQLACGKFLEAVAKHGRSWDVKSNAITCRSADTVKDVVKRMQAAKIHRVYLCDDNDRPYRVVSYRDLICALSGTPADL